MMIVHLPGPDSDKLEACIMALGFILIIAILAVIIGVVFDLLTGHCGAICQLLWG